MLDVLRYVSVVLLVFSGPVHALIGYGIPSESFVQTFNEFCLTIGSVQPKLCLRMSILTLERNAHLLK